MESYMLLRIHSPPVIVLVPAEKSSDDVSESAVDGWKDNTGIPSGACKIPYTLRERLCLDTLATTFQRPSSVKDHIL